MSAPKAASGAGSGGLLQAVCGPCKICQTPAGTLGGVKQGTVNTPSDLLFIKYCHSPGSVGTLRKAVGMY